MQQRVAQAEGTPRSSVGGATRSGRGEATKVHPGECVLVVDDERENRDLLTKLLGSQGYEVLTAVDGASALACLRERNVGLVLLDVMMPRMDGIEVCAAIRREPSLRTLPIVVTSSLTDRESRVRAKEAGADDFLVKPIDTLELLIRVENLWKLRVYHELVAQHKQVLERELEAAGKRLVHMERLTGVGSLAAGVGHELGSLAETLRHSLDRLRDASRAEREDLDALSGVLERLENHARRLSQLGEGDADDVDDLPVNDLVRGAAELLERTGRVRHASLRLELPAQSPVVRAARQQLQQVLLNLMLNAAEALLPVEGRAREIAVHVEARDALERTRISVVDNGVGIAEDDLGKVFEPYFTTKAEGVGTGLGLNLVRHIVESVGGRVLLVSKPGLGTTAIVDFPALAD